MKVEATALSDVLGAALGGTVLFFAEAGGRDDAAHPHVAAAAVWEPRRENRVTPSGAPKLDPLALESE
jgi:hypothetical protein